MTSGAFVVLEIPLLQPTLADVLAEEHVEGRIYVLQHAVSDEHNGIEAIKDHADFCSCIPAVVASSWEEGSIEAEASTAAQGFEKCCTVPAVRKRIGLNVMRKSCRWRVKGRRCDTTILVAFEMNEVAGLSSSHTILKGSIPRTYSSISS